MPRRRLPSGTYCFCARTPDIDPSCGTLNQMNQDMRAKPLSQPERAPSKRSYLGSGGGWPGDFLDELPPAGSLFVPARDDHSQAPFAEGADFKRGGRPQEGGLNFSGQSPPRPSFKKARLSEEV
jgi:hypothetical protein